MPTNDAQMEAKRREFYEEYAARTPDSRLRLFRVRVIGLNGSIDRIVGRRYNKDTVNAGEGSEVIAPGSA